MTVGVWIALIVSQLALVAGQVFLKKAMADGGTVAAQRAPIYFAAGVFMLSVWFFLWLGMMARLDLSQQMPLEAISPILIMGAGVLFLGERCGLRGWLGLVLTGIGVYFVAAS